MSDSNESTTKTITYNDVATKLLNDKLLLSALELHTELVESGRELRQLKDFFSNPGNFELQTQEFPRGISRSGSQVTLDSLDLTRLSEDGGGTDERVAVLEFELRKAKETINALRNNLTVATESENSTPDKGSLRPITIGTIKPHEQRALNFLINEYLLLYGYKLTSITFADENQSQDFDDWDDVGLNISKPPELLTLYREGLKQTGQNLITATSQTDEYENELDCLKKELNDCERANLELKTINVNLNKEIELLSSQVNLEETLQNKCTPINSSNNNNSKDSLCSSNSPSPERFEIIDKNLTIFKKRDSIITLLETDNISNNSLNANECWTNVSVEEKKDKTKEDFDLDDVFKKEVFSLCYVNIPHKVDNEIFDYILNNSVRSDTLIHIVSLSLLRIIPNIILNKREEAIPLLMSGVLLNNNSNERDKLLQQLFNLKKKPSDTERIMILTGIVGIARFSNSSLVENEILPQCWEQLTHKHVERRLLVAEACTALIPYVSSPIRNSLIISMLQQMLDDREESVRETVIRALSLVLALCDDQDKYNQCEELALNCLNDSSSNIVNLTTQILFPILGKWALNNGRLERNLLKSLLHKLNDSIKESETNKSSQVSDKILRIIKVLENLLTFLLMSVVCQENILCKIEKDMSIELRSDLIKLCRNLTNPSKFFKSDVNVGMILYEFDRFINDNRDTSWPELDWILDIMIPDLLNNLNQIENAIQLLESFINFFSHISIIFGKSFTKFKIRPIFEKHLERLEQILSTSCFNQFSPNLNIVPVYLVSILTNCDDDDEVLNEVLKRFLFALPLCGTPLDCLEISVKGLCEFGYQESVVSCLWDGVVHQRPLVRSASATLFSLIVPMCCENLLVFKITPALVTLASDTDVLVKTAAIPALGSLITDSNIKEIHDKVYMQLQSYIADNTLMENHTLLRQLIVTLGNIYSSCISTFRQEVIQPHLSSLSIYMSQMSNQTRKIDMALALVEAFTNVVYSSVNKQNLGATILPGLRCLENVVTENQSLLSHRDTVLSMIKECDCKFDSTSSHQQQQFQTPPLDRNKLTQNVNQGVEEMRQRVSKIFNKPSLIGGSKPNSLQGIFQKKK